MLFVIAQDRTGQKSNPATDLQLFSKSLQTRNQPLVICADNSQRAELRAGESIQKTIQTFLPADPSQKKHQRLMRGDFHYISGRFGPGSVLQFFNTVRDHRYTRKLPVEALELLLFELRR